MHWQVEMFGGLRVTRGGVPAGGFQTRKTAALFAFLAFYSQKNHLREELADMLWPDAELESGRHRLAQALFAIRSQFEAAAEEKGRLLQSDRVYARILPAELSVDAITFDRAAISALGIIPVPDRTIALEKALTLYGGDFLPGFYDDWVLTERQRLATRFTDTSRALITLYEGSGQYEQAIVIARAALAVNPLAEDLSEDLMRLLVASGQPGSALGYYRELERIMLKELGEPPSRPIRSFMEMIRENESTLTYTRPAIDVIESNLPDPLTRFFGRQNELNYIQSLIDSGQSRLISITGMGGSGKTRLSIEAARAAGESFNGAVYFVGLAELESANQIPDEIVSALHLTRFADTTSDQVVEFLRRHKSLLILDNLEHIQEDSLPFIQDLLAKVPSLSLMVTSRARLRLVGEREIPLPPLQTPQEILPFGQAIDLELLQKLDIVRLFIDRAQAVRPGFQLTERNALTVAQICEKLEGIPLAMELCAAWAQMLSPEQMLAQLDKRFDLLASRSKDLPPRHRSLRAAMEYSAALLPDDAQTIFTYLSVFSSGWTLEAAAAVCSLKSDETPFSLVTALADLHSRSLIIVQEAKSGDEMRYRMLETVREFAGEQLDPNVLQTLREKHANYYLNLTESAEISLMGPDQMLWLKRLDDEHDNLRTALGWIFDAGDARQTLRIVSALTTYWDMRGYLWEGNGWLKRALELPISDEERESLKPFLAKALTSSAFIVRVQGNDDKVAATAKEGLRLYRELGDQHGIAFALQVLSVLTYTGEDCDEARLYLEEGLDLARHLNDRSLLALSLANLGNIALEQANYDEADCLYSESLKLYSEMGNRHQMARILNNSSVVATFRADYDRARQLLSESLTIAREQSNYGGIALCLHNLGDVERKLGNFDEDIRYQLQCAHLAFQIGERRLLAFASRDLGHCYIQTGQVREGVRLLALAEVLKLQQRLSFKPADPVEREQALDQARQLIGSDVDTIWNSGLSLRLEEAYSEVLLALNLV